MLFRSNNGGRINKGDKFATADQLVSGIESINLGSIQNIIPIVPIMKSNSQDGFILTSSSAPSDSRFPVYNAFNSTTSTSPVGGFFNVKKTSIIGEWVQVELPEEKMVRQISIMCRSDGYYTQTPTKFKIEAKNVNDDEFILLGIFETPTWTSHDTRTFDIENNNLYNIYRYTVIDSGNIGELSINEMQFYEVVFTSSYTSKDILMIENAVVNKNGIVNKVGEVCTANEIKIGRAHV